jgi:hypothetical protein
MTQIFLHEADELSEPQQVRIHRVAEHILDYFGMDPRMIFVSFGHQKFLGRHTEEIRPSAEVVGNQEQGYLVVIRSDREFEDILVLLAHELVHIWQTETGRLLFSDEGILYYDGIAQDEIPYMKRKFEIEAYELQDKLVIDYNYWAATHTDDYMDSSVL